MHSLSFLLPAPPPAARERRGGRREFGAAGGVCVYTREAPGAGWPATQRAQGGGTVGGGGGTARGRGLGLARSACNWSWTSVPVLSRSSEQHCQGVERREPGTPHSSSSLPLLPSSCHILSLA